MGMLKWVLIIVDLLYIIFVLIPRIWWEKYWNLVGKTLKVILRERNQ
jgi:hypothetical protein